MGVTLAQLAHDLASGRVRSRDLVEAAIAARSADAKVFLATDDAAARAQADAADRARDRGRAPSPWAGVPISLKDLFDQAGQVTRAGSRVLAEAPPAACDAPVVARLRAAGFVSVGRTNMTEFAYSGLGLNPHYGTPINPHSPPGDARIPGGSSSGAAVSVATGMAVAALGTDTGGSCRIPAAYCGLVGFKPTARRVPLAGVYPLAPSLDSVGPLARSVACCRTIDAIVSGGTLEAKPHPIRRQLRFAVPAHYVLNDLDEAVARAFDAALDRLSAAGHQIVMVAAQPLEDLPAINSGGGLAAAEAYHHHRELLATHGDGYDPRVASRIQAGAQQTAADLLDCLDARRRMRAWARTAFAACDALLMPTVPTVAPNVQALGDDEAYTAENLRALRNPSVVNFLDGAAFSIPMPVQGGLPAGLMLASLKGDDSQLTAVAALVEDSLSEK